MRFALACTAAVLATLVSASINAQVTPDKTTVSFSFADDNVLRDPGETRRNSPEAYFGQSAYSYLDRVEESAFRRTESRLNFTRSYRLGDFSPAGGVKMRFGPDSDGKMSFRDDGTMLSLAYQPDANTLVALDMYPIDSDTVRLGYHRDISWGGSNVFPKNFRKGLVPAALVRFETGPVNGFVGAKTALIRSPSENILNNPGGNTNQFVERAYYGFFGGVGVEFVDGLRLDLSGGFFEKGTNTKPSVLGKPIYAGGGSAQLSYSWGSKVGKRLDLRLYFEDPDKNPLDIPARGSNDWGLELAVEYTRLVQTLEDPDHYASTHNEWAQAGYFSAGLRFDKFRVHLDGIYRDLPFIVFNVPGFVPYQALSEQSEVSPELFGALSADYYFDSVGITVAMSAGVLLPATYKPTVSGQVIEGPFAEEVAKGIQKVVVRGTNSGDWDILPPGEDQMPVFVFKGDVKYNLGQNFFVVAELSYGHDPNFAQVFIDERGHAVRQFDKPEVIGFGVTTEFSF